MRLSYSAMSLFDSCAMRYQHERVLKLAVEPAPPLIKGILAHEFIRAYLHHLSENHIPEDRGVVPDLVEQLFTTNGRIKTTEFFDDVLATARTFAKGFHFDYESVVELEGEYNRTLLSDVEMIGYVDMIYVDRATNGLVIRDFKSGWAADYTDSMEFQGDIYAWFVKERYPDRQLFTEVHFVRSNTVTPRRKIEAYHLESVERRMRSIWARMQQAYDAKEYPPSPGSHCGWCPIALKCVERLNLTAQREAIKSPQDAPDALGRLIILKAAADHLTRQLKAVVDASGPVQYNGVQIGWKHSQSIGIADVSKFIDTVGLDEALTYLRIDGTAAKKLSDDPRLDGLWATTRSSRKFEVGKVGAAETDAEAV
jgi:hypothetical protein